MIIFRGKEDDYRIEVKIGRKEAQKILEEAKRVLDKIKEALKDLRGDNKL